MAKIKVHVLYLGGSRGETGTHKERWELTGAATLEELIGQILKRHPRLKRHQGSVRWARNYEFVTQDVDLADGDEIALIPPVAGGAPTTLPRSKPRCAVIQADAIAVESVVQKVRGVDCGAVISFIGTVRDRSNGHAVQSLRYEAYEPMATRTIERIVSETERRHENVRAAVTHRVGTLIPGEISLVIATASPHRDTAFLACRAILEAIKCDVPIWKLEKTTNGQVWVGWGGG